MASVRVKVDTAAPEISPAMEYAHRWAGGARYSTLSDVGWTSARQPGHEPLAEVRVGEVPAGALSTLKLANEALRHAKCRGDISLGQIAPRLPGRLDQCSDGLGARWQGGGADSGGDASIEPVARRVIGRLNWRYCAATTAGGMTRTSVSNQSSTQPRWP